MAGNINSHLLHHANGDWVEFRRRGARTGDFETVPRHVAEKAFRHLTSAGIGRAEE